MACTRERRAEWVRKAASVDGIPGAGQRGISAVIFDLDGVLVDSEPAHLLATHRLVAPAVMGDGEYRAFIGGSLEAFVEAVRVSYHPTIDAIELARRYDELVVAAFTELKLPAMDGAAELVAGLKARGIGVAVASQSQANWVDGLLGQSGLLDAFDLVLSADASRSPKPSPAIYLHAASALSVPPEACLVIEDSIPGVRAGLAAGMTVVQSRQSSIPTPPQPGVQAVIDSLRDFGWEWLHPGRL